MNGLLESSRFGVLMWVLVFVSALAVVLVTHYSRGHFIEWQDLLSDAESLDVEWGQLLLEKSSSSSYSKLEGVAKNSLHMSSPEGEHLVLLKAGEGND